MLSIRSHRRFRFASLGRVLAVLSLAISGLLAPELRATATAQDGPLSEYSVGGMRAGSRSVHEGSRTLREGSAGSVRSGPVYEGRRGGMKSGPVSESSAGPVSRGLGMAGGGSIGQSSVGAVKKRLDEPLGTRISESLTDLEQLQEELRDLRPSSTQEAGMESEEEDFIPEESGAAEEVEMLSPEPEDVGSADLGGELDQMEEEAVETYEEGPAESAVAAGEGPEGEPPPEEAIPGAAAP